MRVELKCAANFCMLFLAMCLVGCGRSDADLWMKVDFSQADYHEGVEKVTGLSGRTDLGRWTDANLADSVKIKLKSPLPPKASILIKGMSLKSSSEGVIKIGRVSERFKLTNSFGYAEFFVEAEPNSDVIEIIPDDPVSPEELGINEDRRKLGFFLSWVEIYKD